MTDEHDRVKAKLRDGKHHIAITDLMDLSLDAFARGDHAEAVRLGRLSNDRRNALIEWKHRTDPKPSLF